MWFTLSYVIPCLHVSDINVVVFRHSDYLSTYVDKYNEQWSSTRLKHRLHRKHEFGSIAQG